MEIAEIEIHDPRWIEILKDVPHDFYHLPDYARLESRRLNSHPKAVIVQEADKVLFLPYLVRECRYGKMGEPVRDVASPQGYPGFLVNNYAAEDEPFVGRAWRKLLSHWRERDLCSVFIRMHPILNAALMSRFPSEHCFWQGKTVSIDLSLSKEKIWKQIRPNLQIAIIQSGALGYRPRMVPFKEYLSDFYRVYLDTMRRVNSGRQLPYEYFSALADFPDRRLHLGIIESEGKVICAGLNSVCGGIVQGMWGGTLMEYMSKGMKRGSPFSFMLWHTSLWAKSEGYEFLHLGGGVGGGNDSLYRYKAGFSKMRLQYATIRAVVNEEKFQRVVKIHANSMGVSEDDLKNSSYFPAYRAVI